VPNFRMLSMLRNRKAPLRRQRRRAAGLFAAVLTPILLLALSGCGATWVVACPPALAGHDVVYVLGRGWHTQIGLAADRLEGSLGVFRTIFPGARAVMFGYGKRTFMVAPPDKISEFVLGPIPGPAVIEVIGLNVSPPEAYGTEGMIALALPPGGAEKLSRFLWNDLQQDRAGGPRLVAGGPFGGSLFYAARSGYDLFHSCNTWIAEALHAAGLPIESDFLVLSGQMMARAAGAATTQCRAAAAGTPHVRP